MFMNIMGAVVLVIILFHLPLLLFSLATCIVALVKVITRRRSGRPLNGTNPGPFHD